MSNQKYNVGNVPGLDRPQNWPVVRGCAQISDGCDNCYVKRLAETTWQRWYSGGFENVVYNPAQLQKPISRRKNSWFEPAMHSDLFTADMPDGAILDVFEVMKDTPQHLYQVCTKSATRLADFLETILPQEWIPELEHVMIGVSIESKKYLWRLEKLRTWEHVKYVEFTPLIGRIENIDFAEIGWVKIGCETGLNARKTEMRWIYNIIDEAKIYGIPVTVTAIRVNGKLIGMPFIDGRKYAEKSELYHRWRDHQPA